MKDKAKLATLVQALPKEAGPHVARLLRQLAHDLDTPLSTFTMDVYSARALVEDLASTTEDRGALLVQLVSVLDNLEAATLGMRELSQTLRQMGALCEVNALTPES